jgi:hypothetical protein
MKMGKKVLAWGVLVSLMVGLASPVLAASTPIESVAAIEQLLYGQAQGGPLVARLDKMEKDLFGETKSGALIVRIENLNRYIQSSDIAGPSLSLRLNAIEWMVYETVSSDQPINRRIEALEMGLYGGPQEGPILDRVNEMIRLLWARDTLKVASMELPKETLVKIRLLTEVNSAKNEVGQRIRYRVVDDVKVSDVIMIPAGAEGVGEVTEVVSAGRMGRDGRVVIDFGTVSAIDGTPVKLEVSERATEKNLSLEMAAGASMAGIVLLGPVGLAGGYFVKGKDVEIPAGTEFFVEVARATRATGLDLRP